LISLPPHIKTLQDKYYWYLMDIITVIHLPYRLWKWHCSSWMSCCIWCCCPRW
jgi:hypothetical protein